MAADILCFPMRPVVEFPAKGEDLVSCTLLFDTDPSNESAKEEDEEEDGACWCGGSVAFGGADSMSHPQVDAEKSRKNQRREEEDEGGRRTRITELLKC